MHGETRYLAGIEMFHQLNCLDFIRRYMYKDEYFQDLDLKDDEDVLIQKQDQCVDHLQQVIMCHGDVGIITYQERAGGSKSNAKASDNYVPEYSTRHPCRTWDPMVEWADIHSI
ncbi:MAG: hypothetical protein M1838_001824 [Thelocarpon superellum]|nr:MAG: hypothetical protein M1838_001824 [Thelocarpon superellum]